MVRVLYIFAATNREKIEESVNAGNAPDTTYLGFRHLENTPGIEAHYLQLHKGVFTFAGGFFRRFALARALYVFIKFYGELHSHDVIVITNASYFSLMAFKKLGLFKKQRFIIINLSLTIDVKKAGKLERQMLLWMVGTAEKIICISKAQKTFLAEQGVTENKLTFIPLGVDKSFYKPIERKGEFILTVGRDIGRDFETFLEAIKISGEKAVMVCSPNNVKGLEDRIPLNLEVIFDLPYSELKNYYKKAKAFVIATKPGESLIGSDCPGQTSILDTLAYGVPVIATEMPWFDGYFESEKNIIIVPPKNPQALSQAVRRVMNEPALAGALSREGRKLIDERCNSEAMGRTIAELILERP